MPFIVPSFLFQATFHSTLLQPLATFIHPLKLQATIATPNKTLLLGNWQNQKQNLCCLTVLLESKAATVDKRTETQQAQAMKTLLLFFCLTM